MENYSKLGDNLFDAERRKILNKVYLANIRNRLRELENPTDIDCKRWIWELVQNAKDSIANDHDRKFVDIKIKIENDKYYFIHNGSPFTSETLFALLYKYSEGKVNREESSGRFGTGFLTTHSLSKVVKVTGDIIQKIGEPTKGFEIIMYREGKDEELLSELKRTEDSYHTSSKCPGWTTFEYNAKTTRNKEAGKLGIQNFKDNIAKVMLFCPEIRSIELEDNGKLYSFSRGEIKENLFGNCKILILNQHEGNIISKRKFLYHNIEEQNIQLTEKFKINRNLRICCAIELDKDNNIIIDERTPCLFCSFPLIGSEEFKLPFIINSPDFEPDSERQTILLDGDYISEKTGIISEPGINKMILLKSQEIYKTLCNYICNDKVGNRYLLASGLNLTPNINRFLDKNWYENNFLFPMRDILITFPIIWKGDHYNKITEIYLPMIGSYHEIDDQKKLYSFIAQLYDDEVPSFEESKNFEKIIWLNDNRIKYIDLPKCIEFIENHNTINSLAKKFKDIWKWLDAFLIFIKHFHPQYLEKYSIIPNMNSEFVKLTNELSSSKEVPENMIELLMSLGIDWKKNHIHKNIINYSTGTDHNIEYATSIINKNLKSLNNMIILIHYIPNDEDEEFKEKRILIYEFCCEVWKDKMTHKKDGTKFPKELWEKIDNLIIKEILEDVEKQEKIERKYTLSFIQKFLEFVVKNHSNYINYAIFPNQNGKFCKLSELYEDDNIPDEFKTCLKIYFNVDIKNNLLDDRFNFLKLNINKKRIYNYKDILKENFQNSHSILSSFSRLEAAAICLLKIIPKKRKEYKDEEDFQDKQRMLFSLYETFIKENCDYIEIERNYSNEEIWKYSNIYIYEIIRSIIERYDSIDSLSQYLEKSKEKAIYFLKMFIKYTKKGKIIINQNLVLCNLDNDLYNEGSNPKESIPEMLKDISKILGKDIRNYLIHESMGNLCFQNYSYRDLCLEIDDLIYLKFRDRNNFFDKNFKKAAGCLIEEYFEIIGEEKAKLDFPKTYSNKDSIILNVIYDKQARKNMTEFGKAYGIEIIPILLKNPNVIKSIIKGELSDSNYKTNNCDLNCNEKQIKMEESKIFKVSYDLDKILDENSINFYNVTCRDILNFGNDFDFELPENKKIRICGEAYIYELLLNSKKYKKVKWNHLSETLIGEPFEYNGKKYKIVPCFSDYNILVESFDNHKLYIEVKTSENKFSNRVHSFICKRQMEKMKSTKPPDKYILALVFNIRNKPDHFFVALSDE